MSRPRLLDLFAGAGGAAVGYARAGFEVVGVDIKPQPRYPFEFVQADALRVLEYVRDGFTGYDGFAAIHASPPCQRFTAMRTMWNAGGDAHPDLVAPTRDLLSKTGLPWVMENVPGAPMTYSIQLCGSMFGLGTASHDLRRHRIFETSFPMLGPTCQHSGRPTIGLYGDHARDRRRIGESKDRGLDIATDEATRVALARQAMQMPWIETWREASEAIPPAYTELIGHQLLAHIRAEAVA